jgi:NADPH-dependent glutamate synthase beta subunit-like oxidoreductase
VTIFEALPVAGGMLTVGIPAFRVPRDIIDYDIRFICQHNVDIQTEKALGKDFTIDDLFQQGYKAVLLALGAHGNTRLGISGEDAQGVLPGVDFLRRVNLGEDVEVGAKVAVIGGGDVAIDAARMVVRLGAKEVHIVYRRTREEMPANVEEIEEAEDEKIKMMYLVAPTRIITANGRVKGMECIRMELGAYDVSGRRRPIPVKGSEFVLEVDTIIPEIGYKPELTCLPSDKGFVITPAGTLSSDPITMATQIPRVFATGDVVTGPTTIVQAMAGGYQAALSIDRYLKGQDLYKDRVFRPLRRADVPRMGVEGEEVGPKRWRARVPYMGVGRRVQSFSEVNLGFAEETAIDEANRCLRCDLEH